MNLLDSYWNSWRLWPWLELTDRFLVWSRRALFGLIILDALIGLAN